MTLDPKDLEFEFPEKENTKGEHLRFICDVTHVPSGMRVRGRGGSRDAAKFAAVAELKLSLEQR